MTANPNCDEVKQAIAETTGGLSPTDRADIVARVFQLKKAALLIKQRLLRCRILGGDHNGREVLTPRILLRPQDTRQPCEWQRLQFPIKVACAMTISKSQGQSLDKAGIYLWSPVFTHGQLYVASSRTGSPDSTIYAVRSPDGMEPFITKNIVFHEIISDAMEEG